MLFSDNCFADSSLFMDLSDVRILVFVSVYGSGFLNYYYTTL